MEYPPAYRASWLLQPASRSNQISLLKTELLCDRPNGPDRWYLRTSPPLSHPAFDSINVVCRNQGSRAEHGLDNYVWIAGDMLSHMAGDDTGPTFVESSGAPNNPYRLSFKKSVRLG